MPEPSARESRPARSPARTERRARTVDAFIDLVLEGHLPPSSEQVAERAGISPATLFRYFDTLDRLRWDAATRAIRRFPKLFRVPDAGVGSRDERIGRFVAVYFARWERLHLLARLLRSTAFRDAGAAEMLDFARAAAAAEVRQHFAPELRALSPSQRSTLVATIASLTSVESWEQFRLAYDRSPAQTRGAWAHAIDRILSDA